MPQSFLLLVLLIILGPSYDARAEDIFHWQTSNIQLLRGGNYKGGDHNRTITTLEHAHGHAFGDTYAFLDWMEHDDGNSGYYGELSPRLSLSKIFDVDLSAGIIKDALISTTLEKGRGSGPRYLYGGAVDLNLPDFKFFKVNAYIYDNTALDGQTWQITLAWNRPFEISNIKFLIEGFTDFQGSEGTSHANQLIVPRFLLDIGNLIGYEDNKLWAGLEYSYWHNKLGQDGVTESVPQAQVKWNF